MHLSLTVVPSLHAEETGSVVLAPRDAALLAWLAVEGPTPRSRLAELLWPRSARSAGRNTLRQRLFKMNRQCGELVSGDRTLCLAKRVTHDLEAAHTILGGLSFPDAPELDAWLAHQRKLCTNRVRAALEHDIGAQEHAGDLAAALTLAEALLSIDPCSEPAHRRVMRLHYLRGDRAEAMLAFDRCERTLKDEIGTRPSPETLSMLQIIEQAGLHEWRHGQPLPASALRPPRLLGRDAELQALNRAWGSEGVFLLLGPAGVGKSRVLGTFLDAHTGTSLVSARPGDAQVPLATAERLAHRLRERWPALGSTAAFAGFVGGLTGPPPGVTPAVRSAAPLLAGLLGAAQAEGLTALVLDDLQFADPASVDLWQEMLAWPALASLRFGFASRTEGEAAAGYIESLAARADSVRVGLPPFDLADVQAFVESLALPVIDPAAVAAALLRRVGGNPLHLLETIRHALERYGRLHAEELKAPARVGELIEQRLQALSADALLLARIAAVARDQFDPELAAAVSGRDVLELADAWHALERQGLLDGRGFMHDVIGEAASRLLPAPIARVLHKRVALHLERGGQAGPARLSQHLLSAGEATAAVPHLIRAARQAWQLGRGREAREAYLQAVEIELAGGRPDDAFATLFDCVESIMLLGPRSAKYALIERLAGWARTPSQLARVSYLRMSDLLDAEPARFQAAIDATLALALTAGDRLIEGGCHVCYGWFAHHAGRLREATLHWQLAIEMLRDIGREERAAIIEGSLHTVLLSTGQAQRALQTIEDARPRMLGYASSVLSMQLVLRRAHGQLYLGRIEAAAQTADMARQALRDTDMYGGGLASTARSIATVLRRCAHWDEAMATLVETGVRVEPGADREELLAHGLAEVYLDLGRPDLAHRHIEAVAAVAHMSPLREQGAATLRWLYDLCNGVAIDPHAVIAAALPSEHLLHACLTFLAAGRAKACDLDPRACAALIERCTPEQLREPVAPLHALQAWLLSNRGEAPAARASMVLAEDALAAGDVGAMTPLCALWLMRASVALGHDDDAIRFASHGSTWLALKAEQTVPAEFRNSFLQRNPAHRELIDGTHTL